MTQRQYQIVFRHNDGAKMCFTIRTACMGNAVAIGWGKLEWEMGSTSGWQLIGRYAL